MAKLFDLGNGDFTFTLDEEGLYMEIGPACDQSAHEGEYEAYFATEDGEEGQVYFSKEKALQLNEMPIEESKAFLLSLM